MKNLLIFSFCLIFLFLLSSLMRTKDIVFNFNNKISLDLKINSNSLTPKIFEKRVFEVDLTNNKIYFFENGKLKKIIPVAYQAPYGIWYQTPTGYFRVGVKHQKHISSLFPVYMNYAVQMYEDFFIHEIPYYLNGQQVTSDFTGGCIRLEKKYAEEFFSLAKTGDLIISYLTFQNFKIKNGFHPPIQIEEFYIRQRFNNPLRTSYTYSKNRNVDYIQHAGIDLAPLPLAKNLNVYSITNGKIVKIVKNGEGDHGLGNTVIVEYQIGTSTIYALYGHMSEINPKIKEGNFVKIGQILGKVGATGYGCNYWRIGEDGCDKKNQLDIHLHLEIKIKPTLESPVKAECNVNGKKVKCYGYTPHNPQDFGYFDPLIFLFEKINLHPNI